MIDSPKNNLIWLDLEMTGLLPEAHRIIEIATIVTDLELNILAEGPVIAIFQNERELSKMDEWNVRHHGKSGLTERVRHSQYHEKEAEALTLNFLQQYTKAGSSPLCGNSICQDRRFLAAYMPALDRYFHYRHLDVSTLKILAGLWAPTVLNSLQKNSTHQALQDIRDSIAELRHYRQHLLLA